MWTLVLIAVLCIAVLIAAWAWEAEKERREEAEKGFRELRRTNRILVEDIQRLRAIEEAAYGMYGVLCLGATLSLDDPQVKAYQRASDAYWKEEVEDATR
jgi:hypothetical protein